MLRVPTAFAGLTHTLDKDSVEGEALLRIQCDVRAMQNAALPDAKAVHAEIEKAIAEALAVETPAVKEVGIRRGELEEAQARLAALQSRRAMLPAEVEHAMAAHAWDIAEGLEAESAALPGAITSCEKRVRILAELLRDAERRVEAEKAQSATAIRERKATEIEVKLSAAHQRLVKAIEPALKEVFRLNSMASACREGWEPLMRYYPLSEAEKAAIAERRAEEDAASAAARAEQNEQWQAAEIRKSHIAEIGGTALGQIAGFLGWGRRAS